MLRCASAIVVAAYAKSTPHSSGFARLASGRFTKLSKYGNYVLWKKLQSCCKKS
jgi:hypothetical protein